MTRRGASVSGVAESSARCRLHVTPGATGTSSAPICAVAFSLPKPYSISPLHPCIRSVAVASHRDSSRFASVLLCALYCHIGPDILQGSGTNLGAFSAEESGGPLPASSSRTQAVEPQRQVKSEKQKERRARPQLPKQRSTQAGAGWLGIIQLGSE